MWIKDMIMWKCPTCGENNYPKSWATKCEHYYKECKKENNKRYYANKINKENLKEQKNQWLKPTKKY